MKTKQIPALTALVLVACSLAMLGGCKKEEPATVSVNVETPKVEFVNAKCPIMGNPINPAKVPANLVRDFAGQKVAFCCAACPPKWDKLSDAEKTAKLAAAQ
ncbi:MAG: hypothetical protein DRP66_03085 [Planctomycetota bacterium]|nr:MAG: hypothetical protein DRP66_03085 [Planctomycetota bacterium]